MASILDNLPPSQWRRAKSQALASVGISAPFSHQILPGHQIEIVSKDVVGDLLFVRLRARRGQQIVIPEAHLFLFVNPPLRIPTGQEQIEVVTGLSVPIFAERPDIAFRNIVAEAVKVALLHRHHSSTLTVYPDGGNPGTNSCDGGMVAYQQSTWALAHDASSATHIDYAHRGNTALPNYLALGIDAFISGYTIARSLLNFLTSALGSGATLLAATFSFVSHSKFDGGGSLSLVLNSVASHTAYAASDFPSFGTARQATDITIASITADNATYNDWALTTLTNISLNGVTHLGIRHAKDVDNVDTNAQDWVNARSADNTGTTQDPKLAITYNPPIFLPGWRGSGDGMNGVPQNAFPQIGSW